MAPEPCHGLDIWASSFDGFSDAGIGSVGDMSITGTNMVEIALDDDLLGALCRRSRRRLRDIQHGSQAAIKLDRVRKLLRVWGTEASIQIVRKQLASLSGPRKPVSAEVWAELMRTRTIQDPKHAVVSRVQQETGCRVHIERSRREVRLFGPAPGAAVAARRIDELARECSAEAVHADASCLSPEVLQGLAHVCRVTLHLEAGRVVVLGLTDNVTKAAQELRKIVAGKATTDWAAACPLGAAQPSSPKLATPSAMSSTGGSTYASGEDSTADSLPAQSMGLVTTRIPQDEPQAQKIQAAPCRAEVAAPQAPVSPSQGAWVRGGNLTGNLTGFLGHESPQQQQRQYQQRQEALSPDSLAGHNSGNCSTFSEHQCCPTCGTGSNCMTCGVPTWQPHFATGADGNVYAVLPMQKSCGKSADGCSGSAMDPRQMGTPWMQWVTYDGGMSMGGGQMLGRMVPVCFAQGQMPQGHMPQGQMPQGMVPVCIASGSPTPTHI